jgi:hypothetical protein
MDSGFALSARPGMTEWEFSRVDGVRVLPGTPGESAPLSILKRSIGTLAYNTAPIC